MRFIANAYKTFMGEAFSLQENCLPLLTAIVLPLAAWTVLALTFSKGDISELPFTVVDNDRSSLSREIISKLDATKYLEVRAVTTDEHEARKMLANGESYFVIYLPCGMEASVKQGRYSKIGILSNGACLIYSKAGYKAMAQALFDISKNIQVKRLVDKGLTECQAKERAMPIVTDIRSKGNPYFEYASYLIPGMILVIFQMSASFSTIWMYRDKKLHNPKISIPAFGSKLSTFAGKLVFLSIINYLPLIMVFTCIFPLAGVPAGEYYMYLLPMCLLYMFVSIGLGLLVSLLITDLATASQILLVLNAMTFIFSGYTYPIYGMPEFLLPVTQIIPLTHFLDAYFEVFIFEKLSWGSIIPFLIFGSVLWLVNGLLIVFGHKIYRGEKEKIIIPAKGF